MQLVVSPDLKYDHADNVQTFNYFILPIRIVKKPLFDGFVVKPSIRICSVLSGRN